MDLSTLTDAQTLGLTAAAEGRAYFDPKVGWRKAPIENMVAVMCAVVNRVKKNPGHFGATVKDACLKPAQFSCWTPGSGPNHDWLVKEVEAVQAGQTPDAIVQGCIGVAQRIIDGSHPDSVNGATHYYSPVSMVPPGSKPTWAQGKDGAPDPEPVASVGDHLFFIVA